MESIHVSLGDRSYDILIGAGILEEAGSLLAVRCRGRRALVVSNPKIAGFYSDTLCKSLASAGFHTSLALVPVGERFKTLHSANRLYQQMIRHRLDRSSLVIALGGGVIGDLAGFAAATYLRGIDFVQVPTTLLAQVDASVGGKVGVDLPQGKNLVGAFHQPKAVLIDVRTLKTLPRRELRSGMAEMVKHGFIRDAAFLDSMESELPLLLKTEEMAMVQAVKRNCEIKASVVESDERESGLRALLNYGHTIGHAIETVTHYRRYRHGEAVSLGMTAAAGIAVRRGLITKEIAERQRRILSAVRLPTKLSASISSSDIMEAMKLDKKAEAGKVRFVLLTRVGGARLFDDIEPGLIKASIEEELSSNN